MKGRSLGMLDTGNSLFFLFRTLFSPDTQVGENKDSREASREELGLQTLFVTTLANRYN